jgi:hypothetical protein
LAKLRRLSLRDREIADVDVLTSLTSLEDLNLEVGETKQVLFQKHLPKLIILDLSQNPVLTRNSGFGVQIQGLARVACNPQ